MTEIKKGQAGRTNYAAWDSITTNLVEQSEQEERQEQAAAQAALGLDGKYARSKAEAEERVKSKALEATKEKLENFKQRETALVQSLSALLGPKQDDESNAEAKQEPRMVRISRTDLEEGKRVLVVCDTTGQCRNEQIVLTSDLGQLASPLPVNPAAKTYKDDAENSAPMPSMSAVMGLIKVNVENVENCTVLIDCKVISGTVEVHQCKNVTIKFSSACGVATVQVDQSENLHLHFVKGGKLEPCVYHAGVSDLQVSVLNTATNKQLETTADYIKDGAVSVGNATPEEYRFVTQVVNGALLTEHIVQTSGGRAMTEREVKLAQQKREQVQAHLLAKAEAMIQMKDKDGNPLVTKTTTPTEVVGDLTDPVQRIVTSCGEDKAAGNEAFGSGEYAQAVLQYSLALDKFAELKQGDRHRVPADVLYSNRAACFLKLGEHEKAQKDAEDALQINPDNVKAQFRRGLALHAAGQYMAALPILAKALEKEPKNKQIKQALQFCEVRVAQDQRKRMQD